MMFITSLEEAKTSLTEVSTKRLINAMAASLASSREDGAATDPILNPGLAVESCTMFYLILSRLGEDEMAVKLDSMD
jgi:hypothetical protein